MGNDLRPMGVVGLLAEANWPLDAPCADDLAGSLEYESLDEVQIEEGGRYIAIYGRLDYSQQVFATAFLCSLLLKDLPCASLHAAV